MSTSSHRVRMIGVLGSLLTLFICGCGPKPNRVVGESNGWTMEEYKKAIAEQDAAASQPQK